MRSKMNKHEASHGYIVPDELIDEERTKLHSLG